MGALFIMVGLLFVFGVAYPAFMALVWVGLRLCGRGGNFSEFMKNV